MPRNRKTLGFSLVEMLLVVALIGIISAIAIPSYLGQRSRARLIGDAQSNAQALRMQLETLKADTGTYGAAGAYTWTSGVAGATAEARQGRAVKTARPPAKIRARQRAGEEGVMGGDSWFVTADYTPAGIVSG